MEIDPQYPAVSDEARAALLATRDELEAEDASSSRGKRGKGKTAKKAKGK